MTNPQRTDITIVLDRSGSMASVKSDVEGGFARFLEDQRKLPGECTLSLTQFDSEAVEDVYVARPIGEAPGMELHPRGMTPLLDAVGRTITRTGERLAAVPEPARPGRVLFVIITDGMENASREFSKAQVRELIERQRRVYQWDFIYLGANVDAFAEAHAMGISAAHAAVYHATPLSIHQAFNVVGARCREVRAGRSAAFTEEEREALKKT
ncbi:MAG: vWA domain-containing protein [Gemmatimonadales bacterium]